MSAPSPANQLYLGPSGTPEAPQSFFSWFWKEQVVNPAHREGNIKCVWAMRASANDAALRVLLDCSLLVSSLFALIWDPCLSLFSR